jgi:hypothetical protein
MSKASCGEREVEFASELIHSNFPDCALYTDDPSIISVVRLARRSTNLILSEFQSGINIKEERSLIAMNSRWKIEASRIFLSASTSSCTKDLIMDTRSEFIVDRNASTLKATKYVGCAPPESEYSKDERLVFFEVLGFVGSDNRESPETKTEQLQIKLNGNEVRISPYPVYMRKEILPGLYLDALGEIRVPRSNKIEKTIDELDKFSKILSIFALNPISFGSVSEYEKTSWGFAQSFHLRSYNNIVPNPKHTVLMTSSRSGPLKPREFFLAYRSHFGDLSSNLQEFIDSLMTMNSQELNYIEAFLMEGVTNTFAERAITQFGIVVEALNNKLLLSLGLSQGNKKKNISTAYKHLGMGHLSAEQGYLYDIRNSIVHQSKFKIDSRTRKRRAVACIRRYPTLILSLLHQAIAKGVF